MRISDDMFASFLMLHLFIASYLSFNSFFLVWIAVFQWMQDNIQAFGGSPKRVILFGESAGAMSFG
jgi:carboxylesterase type B